MTNSADAEGPSAVSRGLIRDRQRLSRFSWVLIAIVLFAAGSLFGVAASSARIQGEQVNLDLVDLVRVQEEKVIELEENVQQIVDERTLLVSSLVPITGNEPERPQFFGSVSGPGIVVTLDDAPVDFQLDDRTNVNATVVHQQDVDAVMNALWRGGAEAISVQDVRVGAATPVRCIGNVILVGSQSFSPPYNIAAIGDTDTMVRALDEDPSVRLYREDAARYQMGWNVRVDQNLVLPPATELRSLQFATVIEDV